MNKEIAFEIDGLNNEFDCAMVFAAIDAVLAFIAPEVELADWELLGSIGVICGKLMESY